MRRYLAVWRIPGAPLLLTVGIIARLGSGMTSLALLLLLQQQTGRYGPAAFVGAAFALAGAATGPVFGRLADRIGPSRVLFLTGVAHPAGLIGLLMVIWWEVPLAVIVAVAAVAGGTYPPTSAALRGAWNSLTDPDSGRHDLRTTALAAETSLFEVVFIVGPMLVAAFVVLWSPAGAIVTVAVATLIGTLTIGCGRVMRTWRRSEDHVRTRGLGPLRVAGFAALLVTAFGLGYSFGTLNVAVPAYGGLHADDGGALGGVLLAVLVIGSATGGIWFGARPTPDSVPRQLAVLHIAFGAGLMLLAFIPNLLAFGAALLFAGFWIAPALTLNSTLVGQIMPFGMVNEAYTWVLTTAIAATALGSAVTGVIVDRPGGVPWAFVLAGLTAGSGAFVIAWPGGSIARAAYR